MMTKLIEWFKGLFGWKKPPKEEKADALLINDKDTLLINEKDKFIL